MAGKAYHKQIVPKDKVEYAQDFQFWYSLSEKYPPLTPKRERFYLEVIHTGSGFDPTLELLGLDPMEEFYDDAGRIEMRKEFIARNMRLVTSRVLRYRKYNDPLTMPLISFGIEGLIKGVDKFELKYNTRFSTYAIVWIDHYINKGLEFLLDEVKHYPRKKRIKKTYFDNDDAILSDEIAPVDGASPTEVADWAYLTTYLLNQDDDTSGIKLNIDLLMHDENECCVLVDNEHVLETERDEIQDIVLKTLCELEEIEANILIGTWGLCNTIVKTYKELSVKYNLTVPSIKKIEQKAYKKLYVLLYKYRNTLEAEPANCSQ